MMKFLVLLDVYFSVLFTSFRREIAQMNQANPENSLSTLIVLPRVLVHTFVPQVTRFYVELLEPLYLCLANIIDTSL